MGIGFDVVNGERCRKQRGSGRRSSVILEHLGIPSHISIFGIPLTNEKAMGLELFL